MSERLELLNLIEAEVKSEFPNKDQILDACKWLRKSILKDQKMNKLDIDDIADHFVEILDFDTLIIWADILNVMHDEDLWFSDEWPDKEDELRVEVAKAMRNVGTPSPPRAQVKGK